MKVLLLESDRVVGQCIKDELSKRNISVISASNADNAILLADEHQPDLVITELTLPSHSGTEFLYEFRTYLDWSDVPIIIFSSLAVPDKISKSKDWQLLGVSEVLYKPNESLQKLADKVEGLIRK